VRTNCAVYPAQRHGPVRRLRRVACVLPDFYHFAGLLDFVGL
jgi:hypothetical protein